MAPPDVKAGGQSKVSVDNDSIINTNRLGLDGQLAKPLSGQVGVEHTGQWFDGHSDHQIYINQAYLKLLYGDYQRSVSVRAGVIPGSYYNNRRIVGGEVRGQYSLFGLQAYGGLNLQDSLSPDNSIKQNWNPQSILVGGSVYGGIPVYFNGAPLLNVVGNYEQSFPDNSGVLSYRALVTPGTDRVSLFSKGRFLLMQNGEKITGQGYHQIKAGVHGDLMPGQWWTDIVYGHSNLPPVFSFAGLDKEKNGYLDASLTGRLSSALYARAAGWLGVQGPQAGHSGGGDFSIVHDYFSGQVGYQHTGGKSKVVLSANGNIPFASVFKINPFATGIIETENGATHFLTGAEFSYNILGYAQLVAQGGFERSPELGNGGFGFLSLVFGLWASASVVHGVFTEEESQGENTPSIVKDLKELFRRGRELLKIKPSIADKIDEFNWKDNHASEDFAKKCVTCHSYPTPQSGELAKDNFRIIDIPTTSCGSDCHSADHGLPSLTATHQPKTLGLMCHQCHGENPAHELKDARTPIIVGRYLPSAVGKADGHPDVKIDSHYAVLKPADKTCATATCHDAGEGQFAGGVPYYQDADKKIIGTVRNDCNHCHEIHAKGESFHYLAVPLSQTGECTPCHDGKHVAKEGSAKLFACTTCHTTADAVKGILGKPETLYHPQNFQDHMHPQSLMSLCFKCHDGEHPNKSGDGTLFGCQSCHTNSNPAPHISFEQHKFTVDKESCQGCHQGNVPSKPNGKYAVVPLCASCHDTHLVGSAYHKPGWRLNHQIEAVKPTAECESCHGNPNDTIKREATQNHFCVQCHEKKFEMNKM